VFSLSEITRIVSGRRRAPLERPVLGFSHDSRAVQTGDLFVALRGQRTDGHRFLDQAYRRGAVGALVSDPSAVPHHAVNAIVVADPLHALQALAHAWRGRVRGHIFAITGSNGKTTTKLLLAHLLAGTWRVHAAAENYNTEIGLPLALLAMPEDTEVGVFELGAERPGDIRLLAEILDPTAALITGVGASHLAGFGTVEAVAEEKWSLVGSLPSDRVAFVNADVPALRTRAALRPSCSTVGLAHGAFRGRIVQDVPRLVLATTDPSMTLDSPLLGGHNAVNVLLAAAGAMDIGLPPEQVESRLRTAPTPPHRLQRIDTPFGCVLDDTYNANPASTSAALSVLASLGTADTQRVFVFGDMLGLGAETDAAHRRIVGVAIQSGVDAILPVGDSATHACRAAGDPRIIIRERTEVVRVVRRMAAERSTIVLVKGSHGLAMGTLVDALRLGTAAHP